MSTKRLSNITIEEYRLFLRNVGCKFIKIEGGHEKWTRKDLNRPIMFQTHISPIPEFIIKNALRTQPLAGVITCQLQIELKYGK